MKVVIFGANGKTGLLLVEQALAKGHQVIAYIRRPGTICIENPKLKIMVGELNEILKLKDAIIGADACISALGGESLTKHSPGIMNGIDNIVLIMEKARVHRFIYLSSLGAGESRFTMNPVVRFIALDLFLRIPMADHNANEKRIVESNLQWTFIRPASLTDGQLTGELKHGISKIRLKGIPTISRANVASFMIQQLTDPTYQQKAVWLCE
jgi:putative NADH-flavin reductase